MILYPPAEFDLNEWFVIGSSVVAWALAIPLTRRLRPIVTFGLWLFNFYLAQGTDFLLATPPLDLYDTLDHKQYEWFDVVLYMVTYPPVGILTGALPAHYRMNAARTAAFIIAASAVTVGLEWLAHWAGVYHYHGWRLLYSFPVYIASYALNVLLCRFMLRHLP